MYHICVCKKIKRIVLGRKKNNNNIKCIALYWKKDKNGKVKIQLS